MIVSSAAAQAQVGLYLWAWDRAEDLRWIEPGVGVAYFAVQLDARERGLDASWRRAPLRVRPDTPLLPVLHVEAFAHQVPRTLDEAAVGLWAQALVDAARRTGSHAFQIDFEARDSQKIFYSHVLQRVRQQLPAHRISMTALASWCGDSRWLASLPVDEVVPMYFRMGAAERRLWRTRLLAPQLQPQPCRQAAGVATDELAGLQAEHGQGSHPMLAEYRWYLFAPRAWKPEMLEHYQRWRLLPAYNPQSSHSNQPFDGVALP